MANVTTIGRCCALATVVVVVACGRPVPRAGSADGPRPSQMARAAFASLHSEADRLIPGSPERFARVLRSLRGYPVVVNEWASWCPACVFEFRFFQSAARRYGQHLAFLGVDVSDSDADARAFLAKLPVPYPSYSDPDTAIAQSLEASGYYPQTLYLDRRGEVVFDHSGSYADVAALERDIKHYGLG
jgi:thiol-disulfide isomerase/thioredoxin